MGAESGGREDCVEDSVKDLVDEIVCTAASTSTALSMSGDCEWVLCGIPVGASSDVDVLPLPDCVTPLRRGNVYLSSNVIAWRSGVGWWEAGALLDLLLAFLFACMACPYEFVRDCVDAGDRFDGGARAVRRRRSCPTCQLYQDTHGIHVMRLPPEGCAKVKGEHVAFMACGSHQIG